MSEYRRWFVPGGTYFLTLVTEGRRPLLTSDHGRQFLREAIGKVRQKRSFDLFATVLLPDHWHLIMILPMSDANYSTRIRQIKEEFTRAWCAAGLDDCRVSEARRRKGEAGVWQPRFWEHVIRDELDLQNHTDYIHWNPCKHQLVTRVRDWPWSSFFRFVKAGAYSINWGGNESHPIDNTEAYGE